MVTCRGFWGLGLDDPKGQAHAVDVAVPGCAKRFTCPIEATTSAAKQKHAGGCSLNSNSNRP